MGQRENLREILYDPNDVPSPTFAGTVLWVALFFFPIPLMLLIHWWLHNQPETTLWLRLVSFITGLDWRVAVAVALTSSACLGATFWLMRNFADPNLMGFVQSITDEAGLEEWQKRLMWITPLVIVPLFLLRKVGIVELALLAGVEGALLSATRIKRFPREEVNLVPSGLEAEVEELLKAEAEVVNYTWSFTPTPEGSPETFSTQIAFNPSRLNEATNRPHQRETDGDWLRFIRTDLQTPEIFALVKQLHDLHEKRHWTPFQRCRNVLALLESFEVDDNLNAARFPLETLREQKGNEGDMVVAAITLLKALKETVPEAVLVISGDRKKVGLGIEGADDVPESLQGFNYGGRIYFFVAPKERQEGDTKRWRWSWQTLPEDWQPISVLTVG